MAHVAARHGSRTASRAEVSQIAAEPLVSWGGWYGASQGTSALLPVVFLQFQRRFESEADLLAVNVTARAGYDPEGLANYIERVQTDPSPPALSPVPTRDQRVQAIRQAITALPQMTYTASGDFVLIRQEIRRLSPAPPPAPKLNK